MMSWRRSLLLLLAVTAWPTAVLATTFTIINNDPTPVSPIGGNPGTTRGEQRLIVVQYATEIWATEIESDGDIRIAARTIAGCPFNGFANVGSVIRDFNNAPLPNIWYPIALANKLADLDLCPPGSCGSSEDMTIILGRDCGRHLRLDNNPPFGDLARVAIHEIGHGLGRAPARRRRHPTTRRDSLVAGCWSINASPAARR